jgi:hypothetical protein
MSNKKYNKDNNIMYCPLLGPSANIKKCNWCLGYEMALRTILKIIMDKEREVIKKKGWIEKLKNMISKKRSTTVNQ